MMKRAHLGDRDNDEIELPFSCDEIESGEVLHNVNNTTSKVIIPKHDCEEYLLAAAGPSSPSKTPSFGSTMFSIVYKRVPRSKKEKKDALLNIFKASIGCSERRIRRRHKGSETKIEKNAISLFRS